MATGGLKGNRPKDYKELAPETEAEYELVRMWRQRIAREQQFLNLAERIEAAKVGDEYLSGKKVTKNARRIYVNYLASHIKDQHSRTLPSVPTPRVEAQSDLSADSEEQVRELISRGFKSNKSKVKATAKQLQWDDARFGIAVGKTTWKMDYEPSTPATTTDPQQIALEIERAEEENLEPSAAVITEEDLDDVHARIHMEALREMLPGSDESWVLHEHSQEHLDRMITVTKEWPQLDRVPVDRFVYDTDVPWDDRAWECEKRSTRIQELLDRGYRNINEQNLPPEVQDGGSLSYEEMTASVWEIHDRRNDRFLVIPADGGQDGLFLHKSKWVYQDSDGAMDIYLPIVFEPDNPQQTHGQSTIQRCIPILDRLAVIDFYIERHVENHSNYRMGGPASCNEEGIKAAFNDQNRKTLFVGSPESWALMKEIQPPPIPPTLLEARTMWLSELRRATGTDAQDTGASNPHAITATESSNRSEARIQRKTDRQEIMGDFLGQVAINFLRLYRTFATLGIRVRLPGQMVEPDFPTIDPRNIPGDLDVFFDVAGETDEAKQERIIAAKEYKDFKLSMGDFVPTNWPKFDEWYGRQLGVKRPEQFRLEQPQGVDPTMAPTGTLPNTQSAQFPGTQGQKDFSPQENTASRTASRTP